MNEATTELIIRIMDTQEYVETLDPTFVTSDHNKAMRITLTDFEKEYVLEGLAKELGMIELVMVVL